MEEGVSEKVNHFVNKLNFDLTASFHIKKILSI